MDQKAIVVSVVIAITVGVAHSQAQHLDVLVQQMNGKLVTGTADFDQDAWVLGERVFHRDFGSSFAINNPGFSSIGAGSPDMPAGAQALPSHTNLSWDFLPMTIDTRSQNLFYWNGQDTDGVPGLTPNDVQFGPLPGSSYTLSLFDKNSVKYSVNGANATVPGGVIDTTASDGFIHRHLFWFLEDNDGSSQTTPVDGLYLLAIRLRMPELANSLPVFMIFGTPGSSVSAEDDAAVPWVEEQLSLTGDYSRNGAVDAADYVMWRKTTGQTGTDLAADGDGNLVVNDSDYNLWRENFGDPVRLNVNSGAGLNAAAGFGNASVPEPASFLLVVIGCIMLGYYSQTGRQPRVAPRLDYPAGSLDTSFAV
jgi:hypothetical protein